MIVTKQGDLLEAKGVIVHGCNAQGVMGSGVAKQVKAKWPKAFEHYKAYIDSAAEGAGHKVMGSIPTIVTADGTLVVNMITQLNYGRDKDVVYVDYEAIREGFYKLNSGLLEYIRDGHRNCSTVNFPLIGCGLGGGDWGIISEIIDEELSDHLEKVLWLQN